MWVKFEITIRYRTESLSLSLRACASVLVAFRVYFDRVPPVIFPPCFESIGKTLDIRGPGRAKVRPWFETMLRSNIVDGF